MYQLRGMQPDINLIDNISEHLDSEYTYSWQADRWCRQECPWTELYTIVYKESVWSGKWLVYCD